MVFEKLKGLLASQLNVDEEKVTMDAGIVDDLGADSLDFVELVMELENEFGVSVPDEATQDLKTVGDIVRYIENAKN